MTTVPSVHACGEGVSLVKDGCKRLASMITDYVPVQPRDRCRRAMTSVIQLTNQHLNPTRRSRVLQNLAR